MIISPLNTLSLVECSDMQSVEKVPVRPESFSDNIITENSIVNLEDDKGEFLLFQEFMDKICQLVRYSRSLDGVLLIRLSAQLNEVLQKEPCFLLEQYQVRIVQLREMLNELQKISNAQRLCSILNQHLIHAEQAARTLYRKSATPVQDSL